MKHLTFKQKVVQGIHDLFYIWIREFRTTFRDQGVLIFFVLVPLVYPLIYAFIYTNETIREVPAVAVDMNADIKMQRAGNTTNRQDEITAYPIRYEDVTLFNPANGFAAFLIPAVLILIIQ